MIELLVVGEQEG
jgi:hypothetical protein